MSVKQKILAMFAGDPVEGVVGKCEDFTKRAEEIGEQLGIALAAANKALASGDLEIAALEFAKCAVLVSGWAQMCRTLQDMKPIVEKLRN